jgi:hypothetical protein
MAAALRRLAIMPAWEQGYDQAIQVDADGQRLLQSGRIREKCATES